jgi:trk system potassium uptake protein TrkH
MFVGGSAGSTAGGIKVSRVLVVLATLVAVVKGQVRPNVVHVVRLDRVALPDTTVIEVLAFVCLYFVFLGAGAFAIVALEPTVTGGAAFGATLSCLSNIGPAPFHVGFDNFAAYTDASKLLFSLLMVIGRLEFLTLLALLLPQVWRP